MAASLSDDLLEPLSSWLAVHTGLHFPKERWLDLNRGVTAVARALQFPNTESYVRSLLSSAASKAQIEGIVRHLTVGETYFFRHQASLTALRTHALPALIQSRRQTGRSLRIWSAGCCTGEEPYSLAILLQQTLLDWREWDIRILATDINTHFLQRARHGSYRDWSFRETDSSFQRTYFTNPQKDCFEILPEIKAMVTFAYLNLAEESYLSPFGEVRGMDLILCRNVLIYFSPEQARKTVQRLHGSLAPDGWLTVSPSEASQTLMSDFFPVLSPGAILYAKEGGRKVNASPPALWQPSEWRLSETVPEPTPPDKLPTPNFVAEHPVPALQAAPVRQPISAEEQAHALYELGDYAGASEILLAALSESPRDAPAMALLARMRANQGKLTEALGWCEKAITADKLNPSGHYLLAAILQEEGHFAAAATSLERALYLDPNFVLAHFSLGNLRQRQGKHHESVRHFRNALRALRACPANVALPESDGITPERLAEIIESTMAPVMENAR
ncbi:MAG TPA: CheR family methyltransferase [Acidobacteriaceae bacterium]|jgi:chemotaxis protein methyltransferase CheR